MTTEELLRVEREIDAAHEAARKALTERTRLDMAARRGEADYSSETVWTEADDIPVSFAGYEAWMKAWANVWTEAGDDQVSFPLAYGKSGSGKREDSFLDKFMRRLFRVPDAE